MGVYINNLNLMEKPKLLPIKKLVHASWKLYQKLFKEIVVPVLIMIAPDILSLMIFNFNFRGSVILSYIIMLLNIIVKISITIYLVTLFQSALMKHEMKAKEIYRKALKKILPYAWVSIISGAVAMGVAILTYLILIQIPTFIVPESISLIALLSRPALWQFLYLAVSILIAVIFVLYLCYCLL